MSGHIKRIWSKGPQAAVIDWSCKHIQKSPQGSIKPGIGPKVWTHTWFSSMPIFGRLWRKLVSGLFLAVVNSLGRRWLLVDASRPEFLFELAAMFGGCKDNWSRMFLAAVVSSWAGFRSGARQALASAHSALCTAWPLQCFHSIGQLFLVPAAQKFNASLFFNQPLKTQFWLPRKHSHHLRWYNWRIIQVNSQTDFKWTQIWENISSTDAVQCAVNLRCVTCWQSLSGHVYY